MTDHGSLSGMISVEDALSRILAHVHQLESEDQPLLAALGQALAEEVRAEFDIPPLPVSAMDGYAVQASSTESAAEQPVQLQVIGEVAAGYLYNGRVGPGTAVRIMTGAPVPPGADAIVPFEETDETGLRAPQAASVREARVSVYKPARAGNNVRPAGEDVRAGETVLSAGTVLHPPQLGVLASLGKQSARVTRRPRVAILSTGDELLAPAEPRQPGRIYDSNMVSIAAMVTEFGGLPQPLGVARDTVDDLTQKIRAGFDCDLIVTSAGVSRGDFDVVKLVLAREGAINFWTVNMRPGKPLAFGEFRSGERRIPHIGLPGNPVSAVIAFEVFGRPAIQRMLGKALTPRPRAHAVAAEPIGMVDGRRFYARCLLRREGDRLVASLAGSQSSGALSSLARANALAVVPEGSPDVQAGDTVDVILLQPEADL